jgi:16S rRNA (cytidine1402-2'-O)-methyltransferase
VGTLYLVATPIGNLEDITLRAVRILGEVNLIAAEDTRHTRKLLSHYQISTPTISYHEHNKIGRLDDILHALLQGDVALVSDAGTPALNDPGYELVKAALQAGHTISPIPGPSAPLAALVSSGLPTDAFLYLGYLPRRPVERRTSLAEIAEFPYTLIFLETPHRLLSSLADLLETLGDRPICVARELTKLHEEIWRGNLSQALAYFQSQPPRGEFTLVVGGKPAQIKHYSEEEIKQAIQDGLHQAIPPAQLAAQLAAASGLPRRKLYALITQHPSNQDQD